MDDQPTPIGPSAPRGGGLRMVVVMGFVGLVSSVVLVATYQVTFPRIEANRRAYLESAILDVIPGASRFMSYGIRDGQLERVDEPEGLYAGFDSSGAVAGVAIEGRGQGYGDVIRILYGYSPSCSCIVGMKVLESKETPGLGDKIEKDAAFRQNFEALDVQTTPNGAALLNPVEFAKNGTKANLWQIEGITGATVSSRAITDIISGSAAEYIPLIQANLDKLQLEE